MNSGTKIAFLVFVLLSTSIEKYFAFSQVIPQSALKLSENITIKFPSESDNYPTFQSLPADFEYNAVRCILKDYKGYMWFGTSEGLVRYDGVNLYIYENEAGKETSLSHSIANDLVEDNNKNLWIATPNGLNLYNREKDNFIKSDSIGGLNFLNFGFISSLCCDNKSRLWIGTYNGLHVYDLKNRTLKTYVRSNTDPNSISFDRITCISTDNENNIWIGTQNGLNLFNEESESFKQFFPEPGNYESLNSGLINVLSADTKGNLWVGTNGGGLNQIVRKNNKYVFRHYTNNSPLSRISNNYILSLACDSKGYLWIGTENGGLNRLNTNTGNVNIYQMQAGYANSLSTNSIWSLYADNEERIWIGTHNKGIDVIDNKFRKFEMFQKNLFEKNTLPDNDVTGFTEDSKGYIWIATDGGGICRFNDETRQFDNIISNSEKVKKLTNNAIQTIICDSRDNLWVGTWAGGIDRLNSRGQKIQHYNAESEQGVGNNNIFSLFEDSKGTIWAGTAGSGLFRYDKKADNFEPLNLNKLSGVLTNNSYITSFVEDSEGNLWISSLNGLTKAIIRENEILNCFDVFNSNKANSLSSNMIDALFIDSENRLWIGTSDEGLNLFNKNDSSFTAFKKEDGLPSNSIKGILEDEDGYLWILTNKGISRFNYQNRSFKNYSKDDGLNSNEFFVRACLRSQKGEFYLGGENGFNIFFPGKIINNPYKPAVYLSDIKINNKSLVIDGENSPLKKQISETSEIKLNYKQSSFSIEFVALNYTHPLRNRFSYKLEGFDQEWNNIGTIHSAVYTNIPPGKYIFLVKGSNNDGVWNETPTRLTIIIRPPFWKTWWAILIFTLFITTVIAIILKFWNERIHIKNQLKFEKLAREKEHELNEHNIQFFTNISHEFRTPLSLIIAPLESIIPTAQSRIKEQLSVIYRNAQRLLHLTNDLMDYRKLEGGIIKLKVEYGDILGFIKEVNSYFNDDSKRRNIKLIIEATETAIHGWFDPEKLETILLNLLSNAFKNSSDNSKIKIHVHVASISEIEDEKGILPGIISSAIRMIKITVTDNGIGIPSEDLPYIFEKFYRSKTSEAKRNPGTGVGLFLVKGLIEIHHGNIWVKSIPGKETRFGFVLPIEREAYSEQEIVAQISGSLNKHAESSEKDISIPESIEELDKTFQGIEKSEILIVEDNEELRTFLANELSKKFAVKQAEDGQKGIEIAMAEIPDLIVSDILMPHCSGIDLCKKVKADIRTCHIPVILLTAKTTTGDQIEGVGVGADAYITKPFNMQLLLAQINQLIQSRQKLFAHFSQDVYILPNKIAQNKMDQDFLQRVIEFILKHIADNNLSVDSLADLLNMSRSTMYRKINALTGKTIVEFIRLIRLKEAIKLMETKKYTLAEIAYQTGFSSPAYFTKSFKDQYGKPPSEFLNLQGKY